MQNQNRPPVRGVPVFSSKRGRRKSWSQRPSRPHQATAESNYNTPIESPIQPPQRLSASAAEFQPQRPTLNPDAPAFVVAPILDSTLTRVPSLFVPPATPTDSQIPASPEKSTKNQRLPSIVEVEENDDCNFEVTSDRDEQSGKLMNGQPRTYKVTHLLQMRDLCKNMPGLNLLVDIDCDQSLVDEVITCVNKPLRNVHSFHSRPRSYRRFPHARSRPKLSDLRIKRDIPLSERQKLLRKTRGILNKIAPDSFDLLCQRLTELIEAQVSCYEEMEIVFDAVVGVGIAQSKFCTVYVDLMKRLSKSLTSRIQSWPWVQERQIEPSDIVRTVVQDCCDKHYFDCQQTIHPEQVWHVEEIMKNDHDIEVPLEISSLVDGYLRLSEHQEEYHRQKTNFVGIEHLVGELVRQQMLPAQTVFSQVEKLLHLTPGIIGPKDIIPAEMEGICTVLRVCGSLLESEEPKRLEECLGTIKKVTDSMDKRMMFMVMDLREFRSAGWTDPRKVKKPIATEHHAGERQFKSTRPQSARARGNGGFRGGRRGSQRGRFRPRRR